MNTLKHLIDPTSMAAIKRHFHNNPDISATLELVGSEDDLGILGQRLVDGDREYLNSLFLQSKVSLNNHDNVPDDQLVYCLYLPPLYVYIDSGKKYY